MSYIIQFSNGKYLAASQYKGDGNTDTSIIKEAYPYMNLISIQRAIEDNIDKTNIERFRGARILTKAGECIRHIRLYKHCFKCIKVTKETDKAILINGMLWIPKSQCQLENNDIWVSKFIWDGILEKYKIDTNEDIINIQRILTVTQQKNA